MNDLYLNSYVQVNNHTISINGERWLESKKEGSNILKEAYSKLELKYPKFFKMDDLCKLGLVATEPIFRNNALSTRYKDDEVALLLANNSSSLESDVKHVEHYTTSTASPAIFVYTLPNIVIGEICIKHQLYGESNFYIFDRFNAQELITQAQVLMTSTHTKACIIGWVEKTQEKIEANFYLIEKEGKIKVDAELLENIKLT